MLIEHIAMLHKLGLVHGDLKPANVFYGHDGMPVVFTDSGTLLWLKDDNNQLYFP
jgi:serine/threonine protein kinase